MPGTDSFDAKFLKKMEVAKAVHWLLKMEEEVQGEIFMISAPQQEPECEVHSDEEKRREERQRRLQQRLNDISSFRDLIANQSQTISMLTQQQRVPKPHRSQPPPIQSLSFHSSETSEFDESSSNSIVDNNHTQERLAENYQEKRHKRSIHDETGLTFDEMSHGTEDEMITKTFQGLDDCLRQSENRNSRFNDDGDDDNDSSELDLAGTDSDVQRAIREIRKEASRINIMMALDQLQTLQSELKALKKAFQVRSDEADDLRIQLEESEERVSRLELERDLFKADASKMRDDLKTCVERMYDISVLAGESSLEPDKKQATTTSAHCQDIFRTNEASAADFDSTRAGRMPKSTTIVPQKESVSVTPSLESCRPCITQNQLRVGSEQTRSIIRQREYSAERKSRQRHSSVEILMEPHDSSRIETVLRPEVEPRRNSFSVQSPGGCPSRRCRAKSLSTERCCEAHDADGKENRRCCMFRRRQQTRNSALKEDDVAIMRQQIAEMHEMVKASLTTSEKLNKRLAMISKYYESIIQKLQEKICRMKNEKRRMEVDLINQASSIDHEKRVAIIMLESKLRQREEEITKLKMSNA